MFAAGDLSDAEFIEALAGDLVNICKKLTACRWVRLEGLGGLWVESAELLVDLFAHLEGG